MKMMLPEIVLSMEEEKKKLKGRGAHEGGKRKCPRHCRRHTRRTRRALRKSMKHHKKSKKHHKKSKKHHKKSLKHHKKSLKRKSRKGGGAGLEWYQNPALQEYLAAVKKLDERQGQFEEAHNLIDQLKAEY